MSFLIVSSNISISLEHLSTQIPREIFGLLLSPLILFVPWSLWWVGEVMVLESLLSPQLLVSRRVGFTLDSVRYMGEDRDHLAIHRGKVNPCLRTFTCSVIFIIIYIFSRPNFHLCLLVSFLLFLFPVESNVMVHSYFSLGLSCSEFFLGLWDLLLHTSTWEK